MDSKFNLLSFSTSWNWRNAKTGKEIIDQIKDLGFNTVELNYKVKKEMLEDIFPMIESEYIKVSSVHNVFPDIENSLFDTDSLLLSYPNKELRKKSVELTQNTIDYGEKLGAKVVVIHPGVVPVSPKVNYDVRLKQLYNDGKKDSYEYRKLFDEMMEFRSLRSDKYTELIKESLEEICEYVVKKGYKIRVGIENRPICTQIPDFREATYLLDELKGYPIYFWYDIGHGNVLDHLGMFDNKKELIKIKDRIIGMHIHDTIGVNDHLAPYAKSNNLDEYIDIIKDIPIKVLELGVKNHKEDIIKGTTIFHNKLIEAMGRK